ncbi:hypothetical protein PENNAL_c0002G07921 [Penicillium nalgiovense]|uniref:Ecp2 effector protein-like domain-containing protein n=1 Tax=Penicillium nalgiovense TaxID=60175 RepID=A0A1V6Z7D0_PENNA|nr:hypothetical protein PENNAL_c0002G07921 [Penicillium nalgiovense]
MRRSVKTYKQNGNENGGGKADATDSGTFDALRKLDVTTPGFMRLPVCSETLARKSWEYSDKTDATRDKEGFPCNNDNDNGSWIKPIERQSGILNFGTCTFDTEGKGRKGNVDEHFGTQDAVDVIRYAAKHWGKGNDKMGKGVMQCDGNIKKQEVH